MSLVALKLNPSESQLRTFGLLCLIMSSVIGAALALLDVIPVYGAVALGASGAVAFALGRASTAFIRLVYQIMILATFPIGWVFSHLVMAFFYYAVITAVAVFFRLIHRDALKRQYDPDADTYWIPCAKKRPASDYFRQF